MIEIHFAVKMCTRWCPPYEFGAAHSTYFALFFYKQQYVCVCFGFTAYKRICVHLCTLANDACNILMISHRTQTLKFACRMEMLKRSRVRAHQLIYCIYLFSNKISIRSYENGSTHFGFLSDFFFGLFAKNFATV